MTPTTTVNLNNPSVLHDNTWMDAHARGAEKRIPRLPFLPARERSAFLADLMNRLFCQGEAQDLLYKDQDAILPDLTKATEDIWSRMEEMGLTNEQQNHLHGAVYAYRHAAEETAYVQGIMDGVLMRNTVERVLSAAGTHYVAGGGAAWQ